MAYPIDSMNLVKRYPRQEEHTVIQKLDSTKPTYLERLPYEIKKMVAEHFQRDDLELLAKISPGWEAAALDVFNTQCMQEEVKKLKACGIWNQEEVYKESPVDFYRNHVVDIQKPIYVNKHPGLQITPEKLVDLQKRQAELFTRQAETELLELKAACYKDIDKGEATFESIEEKHRLKEIDFVAEGLNNLILATSNPKSTRSLALEMAAENGQLEIVQSLILNSEISDYNKFEALRKAGRQGHLEIVKLLMVNGAIQASYQRGSALTGAAAHGHLNVVQALLANGPISDKDRGFAVQLASENNYLEIVQFLIAGGAIIPKISRGF